MKVYREGDLLFQFPDDWGVRAYDQHTYYRGLSGVGLKGVDFLLIDPSDDGHLYFLEVKNYRTRISEDGTFVATPKPPRQLATTISSKYEDTSRAIRAIYGYYRRRWWYRLLESWLQSSSSFRHDRVFWTRAQQLLEEGKAVTVLLWLEVEARDHAYVAMMESTLREELALEVAVEVFSSLGKSLPGITVEQVPLSF